MLNSESFTQRLGASTVVCTTFLLVAIGGCSTAKTPEASSSAISNVAIEETSPVSNGGVTEETPPPPVEIVIEKTPATPGSVVTQETKPIYKPADSTVVAKAESVQEIPKQFQGEWNADLAQCGSEGSDGRLEIKAKQVLFYESSGPIQDITSDGDRNLTGTVELSGEGETWQTELELQLSEDKSALTQIMDDNSFVRYRCS
ncbi:hypothetical protein C1752_00385 [Acaryochloris thomasi RCC1774]|uniref:Uncharacterized protein n=1 Tax=Acaryochloris thomasi RCC1774 TaxID=1764569 RepID=A0A2W1JPZ0_9CYAN|nr:hypothetical protein [Acaryochloris thomasi]PZD75316.1 hypothetical protein C1752_00385 [Acaryochloris thomasi RCC1774]